MRSTGRYLLLLAAGVGASLWSCGLLDAQVDESLVARRWKMDNFWAETYDKPILTSKGDIRETGESIQIFHWDSQGRIKFDKKDLEPPVWIGYRFLTVSVFSESDLYNHTYSDAAMSLAVRLGSIADNWSVVASAGMGTANDGRWDNPHALFPVAALDFARKIDATTLWHIGVGMDGNRGLLPLVPLPYLLFETELEPHLNVLLGFPRAEVVARPVEPLTLTARFVFPTNAAARVEADLGSGWSFFTEVSRRIDGFHIRHQERTRQFYEMNAAEVGVRWNNRWVDLSLSAGVLFTQRFFTGPDIASRTRGNSIDDLAFIALTLPSTFWRIPF
jgi:hypothetical protein